MNTDKTSPPSYLAALAEARRELQRLLDQRLQLEGRIAWVQATIAHLEQLTGQPQAPPTHLADVLQRLSGCSLSSGITDACRTVLSQAGRPLSLQDVLLVLEQCGWVTRRYVNPVAVLSTVLHRLVDRHQASKQLSDDGKALFQWLSPEAAPTGPDENRGKES